MKNALMQAGRTWLVALLPPVALLAAAWAIAAPPDPEGALEGSFTLSARGVQIYECRARPADKGEGFEWAFVAPEAELFDAGGRHAGTHGAGPHWLAGDGSRVEGKVVSRQDAPLPGAIPWLLLQAQGGDGRGLFGRVGHIQRVNTRGGVAPADGCRRETLGQTVRVPYTADYRYLERAGS